MFTNDDAIEIAGLKGALVALRPHGASGDGPQLGITRPVVDSLPPQVGVAAVASRLLDHEHIKRTARVPVLGYADRMRLPW